MRHDIAGIRVNVLGLRAYLVNKRAAGRPKDLLDLALLEEGRRKKPRRK